MTYSLANLVDNSIITTIANERAKITPATTTMITKLVDLSAVLEIKSSIVYDNTLNCASKYELKPFYIVK